MDKVFVVDYAFGFRVDTCEPDYVSRLRSEVALRALRHYPHAYIVLGAGMKEATGNCGPIAAIMQRFLESHGVSKDRILLNPQGRDTLSETEAAYALADVYGGGKIVCATSAFHARRVALIWRYRFGIEPEMLTSALPSMPREAHKEFWKIPRDIVRSLLKRGETPVLHFIHMAKRILLVEDEKALATVLNLKLKGAGYETTVVYNGDDALTEIKGNKYDLVLMDIMMPKRDGFSVLEEMKASHTEVPVFAMSNLGQEEDIARVKNLGVKEYIVKADTSPAEILSRVSAHFGDK